MANGVYGTMIPSRMTADDIKKCVDIFYSYSETRNSSDVDSSTFNSVDDVNSFLSCITTDANDEKSVILDGLYNLKLPASIFGKKGFYTIYIKPKEIEVTISDVSVLRDFPNIRGVVLDTENMDNNLKGYAKVNNGLVGYRMILIDDNGDKMDGVRIVTSNNRCMPVTSVSSSDSNNSRSYSYQYNDNSSFTFLTITPSLSLSFNPSSTPYIGKATQRAYLVNTLFEPVCIEIEMVENDADTIATYLNGSQVRDLNHGLVTTFDSNNNIVMQHELSTLKKTETGTPQYEIRENRVNNIDFSQTLTDKIG